jgi:chromosome segregation ATPase
MIEPIMIFGIGFLAASLCGLLVIPLFHNRAVRLTKKRLEAAAPISMTELQADKDQLRAEFAMSTRRLELQIEQLKADSAGQLAELGKKADAVNLLKIELHDQAAQIETLQASEAALQGHLNAMSAELSAKTTLLQDTERTLADKVSVILKLTGDLNEHALAADGQRFEIIALRTQLEAHKEQISELRGQIDAAKKIEADVRAQLAAARREIVTASEQERAENAMLRDRINEIAAQIAQLTMTLEGPFSPIESLLAATAENPGAMAATHAANGGKTAGTVAQHTRTLGERIRELQLRAARKPAAGGSTAPSQSVSSRVR